MREMKRKYDFTRAEQGKFCRPLAQLEIPVYLDRDVRKSLLTKGAKIKKRVGAKTTISGRRSASPGIADPSPLQSR